LLRRLVPFRSPDGRRGMIGALSRKESLPDSSATGSIFVRCEDRVARGPSAELFDRFGGCAIGSVGPRDDCGVVEWSDCRPSGRDDWLDESETVDGI
jgi:hypothetical protein